MSVRERLVSIDRLRGIVMVLMALDHVRDYFTNAAFSPTDLTKTTPALFFTRIVTHFCAPVFVFLAGTAAYLSRRGKPASELARFLAVRGVWLLFLEVTVVRFGWMFNLSYRLSVGQVIWAIGWSMLFLAPLVFLPSRVVLAIGLVIVFGHHALDHVHATGDGLSAALLHTLHEPGVVRFDADHRFFVAYPLVPWIGVISAGYGFGEIMTWERDRRRRALTLLGAGTVALFIVLRAIDRYGDPSPWTSQPSPLFTALSFLNTTKYPPSVDYLAMTLGPSFLLLRALDGDTGQRFRPILIFGRVPLFYYLIHIPVIHAAAVAVAVIHRGTLFPSLFGTSFPFGIPPAFGYPLPIVYLVWALVVVGLYPVCVWFAGVKARHPGSLLRYL